MILASVNAAITLGGMALGGWRTGRRRKERVLSCGSVWGRIAPPADEEFVGGCLLWAFEDNDGDSDQGFKAGTLDVTMLARWRDDKSAAGWTTVLARWCDDKSAARRMAVLASWRDNKLAVGRTTVLTHWRNDKSVAGRTTVLPR